MDRSTRLEALLLVAAKLARAESRGDAVRIAVVGGVAAIGGTRGLFVEGSSLRPARAGDASGERTLSVPVRAKEVVLGTLRADLSSEDRDLELIELLADLLGAALERETRVDSLVRELGQSGEAQRFLAQSSEALSLSLDDKTTLNVLARLAVPRLADWCVVDAATRDGVVSRVAVTHGDAGGDTASRQWEDEFAASLKKATPPRGAIGPESRETLARDLGQGELPADLAVVAKEMGATSAVIVYAFGAWEGIVRIALFAARSGRSLGFDDFALAEELARRTSHALERASLYGEAQRANEAKDVFLATVSHELRGPLAAVSMWTHVLGMKKCDDATLERAVQAIDESVRAQGRLIEDMIDLSRLAGGKLQLTIARVSLAEVARGAIEQALPVANAKEVGIVLRAEADAKIDCDMRRLAQAIRNVLSNAIDFTPAGGKVDVGLTRLPEGMRVEIHDEGEGISPEFLPHVFKGFRQEDASLTRARGGLGLGLAVARQIVELHDGTIRAESAGRGRGATFTIELPLAISRGGTAR